MRYLVGFGCVLAVLVALPQSVSAQAGEEGATPEPAPEKPALQLQLEAAGVEIVPIPPTLLESPDRQEIERMERRVKRAWIGFSVSAGGLVVGGLTILAANTKCMIGEWTESCNRIENAGIIVMSAGGAGMIATGALVGVRKRKVRELQQGHYGQPRRVQWDVAQSRLVF